MQPIKFSVQQQLLHQQIWQQQNADNGWEADEPFCKQNSIACTKVNRFNRLNSKARSIMHIVIQILVRHAKQM